MTNHVRRGPRKNKANFPLGGMRPGGHGAWEPSLDPCPSALRPCQGPVVQTNPISVEAGGKGRGPTGSPRPAPPRQNLRNKANCRRDRGSGISELTPDTRPLTPGPWCETKPICPTGQRTKPISAGAGTDKPPQGRRGGLIVQNKANFTPGRWHRLPGGDGLSLPIFGGRTYTGRSQATEEPQWKG